MIHTIIQMIKKIFESLTMPSAIWIVGLICVLSSIKSLLKSLFQVYEPPRIEINSEDKAIDKMLQFLPETEENTEDTVKILFENVAELKEYYGINKEQEKKAFYSTIVAGFCGLGLFFIGTIIFLISGNNQIVIVTSIASAIIEIVSCLFMKLLKNTLKQMKEYHTGLEEKEMYLIALKIAELLPEEKRNEQYEKIIEKILGKK